jgi:hypothetical protein
LPFAALGGEVEPKITGGLVPGITVSTLLAISTTSDMPPAGASSVPSSRTMGSSSRSR